MRHRLQDLDHTDVLDRTEVDLVEEAARRELEQAAMQVLLSAIVVDAPVTPWS